MLCNKPVSHALTIFADDSSPGKANYVSNKGSFVQETSYSSAQQAEIKVLILTLTQFNNEPVNIYSDSAYTVGIAKIIETALIGHTYSEELYHLFLSLQKMIQARQHPCFIGHLRPSQVFQGPLLKGMRKLIDL